MYILAHMVRGEKDSHVLKDEIFLAGLECVDQLKDVWVVQSEKYSQNVTSKQWKLKEFFIISQ